jgi:hypothetical protein
MTRIVTLSIISIIVGIIIFAGVFPYYYFEWGIQSCQGLPTDAANCGDADMGGVLFVLYSLPFFALGILGLAYAGVRALIRRYKRTATKK